MKQSSTVLPFASFATASRLYFWSRKKPVFCPFSKSTVYRMPFSVMSSAVPSGTALAGQRQPALALRHALQRPKGGVVAFVHAPDDLPVLPQDAVPTAAAPVP